MHRRQRNRVSLNLLQAMNSTPCWVGTAEAAEALGISQSVLRQLQKSKKLPAGRCWIWTTGVAQGPLGWSIEEIKKWQVEQTLAIEGEVMDKAAAVETFS